MMSPMSLTSICRISLKVMFTVLAAPQGLAVKVLPFHFVQKQKNPICVILKNSSAWIYQNAKTNLERCRSSLLMPRLFSLLMVTEIAANRIVGLGTGLGAGVVIANLQAVMENVIRDVNLEGIGNQQGNGLKNQIAPRQSHTDRMPINRIRPSQNLLTLIFIFLMN